MNHKKWRGNLSYSNFGKLMVKHLYNENGTEMAWSDPEFPRGKSAMYEYLSKNT